MALFKKRSSPSSADDAQAVPPAPAAVDPLRRRARHRLMGATILVIAAVVCLPWLFDAPPPAVSTQVPISIGGQETVVLANAHPTATTPAPAALPVPASSPSPAVAPAASAAGVVAAPAQTAPPVQAAPAPQPQPASATPPAPSVTPAAPVATTRPEARPEAPRPVAPPPAPAATPATPPKPATAPTKPETLDALIAQRQAQESAKPAAAATPKPAAPAAATPPVNHNFPETGRFVVQIGAFVEPDKVASVRQQLSRAGLANFTQEVTVGGKKVTRVRMGPFATRKQMEQAAAKARALGLPVSLYQL